MKNIEKYKKAFVETLEVDANMVESMKYRVAPEWDSLGHMSLIVAIEKAFGITMDTDDVINFSSYEKGKEILTINYGVQF